MKTQSSIMISGTTEELANGEMNPYFIGETIYIDSKYYAIKNKYINIDTGFITYGVENVVFLDELEP